MKQCLSCNSVFVSNSSSCNSCGLPDEIIDGFPAYSPSSALEGIGFKSSYFAELAKSEDKNFWFRARNKLIAWSLKKYHPHLASFLEIGCGTGYVLKGIATNFPNVKLKGSELFISGLTFAAERLPNVQLMQMDARIIPFIEEFDSIGAFDVIEHIDEDRLVLNQIHKALTPEGVLILTVPQHSWLWSPIDEYACHVRRYSAKDLHSKLKDAGFELLRSTSFVTSLLPIMYVSRIYQKLFNNKNKKPLLGSLSILF